MPTLSPTDGNRNEYPPLKHSKPIRTFVEVADLIGMKPDEVKYLERRALRKMRAALTAFGYNR
jgi:DNA-directed RNA polymerase sigma subunit (sigma70/sigma32)